MKLSYETLGNLANDHCQRVIDNMSHEELIKYAKDQMVASFFFCGYIANENVQSDLLNDMVLQENGDTDSVYEFMVGAGVDGDDADKIINEFMS